MSRFSGVEPFVRTAELRSFRAAARELGVTPTAISKSVSALEADLGVKLLIRTTRHVAPTAEGELYLRHAREALDRLTAGRDQVTRSARVAKGNVRVSLSFVLGRAVVAGLDRFLARYPGVQVDLRFDDAVVNLGEREIDVAVRFGELPDSDLVAKRLRTARWATVAAPSYLATRPEIRVPADLRDHTCAQFVRPTGALLEWPFAGGGVLPERSVLIDRGDLLVDAAVAGLGVAQVFDFMVDDAIRRGDLVEVLRAHAVDGPPVHAMCLPGRQRVPKIRAFMEFLAERLG